MKNSARLLGAGAEKRAVNILRNNGYRIIETNYLSPFGEIDIIAEEAGCTVFAEVKFRGSMDFGGAAAAVMRGKQRRIAKTAMHYLKRKGSLHTEARFDVIALGPGPDDAEIIRNAFESLVKGY